MIVNLPLKAKIFPDKKRYFLKGYPFSVCFANAIRLIRQKGTKIMKNLKLTNENQNENSIKSKNFTSQNYGYKNCDKDGEKIAKKIGVKRLFVITAMCTVMLIIGLSGCGFGDDRVDVPINGSDYVTVTKSDAKKIELYPLGFYDRANDRITSTAQFGIGQKLNVKNLQALTSKPMSDNLLYFDIRLGFSDGRSCAAFFESLNFSLKVYENNDSAAVTLDNTTTKSMEVCGSVFKYEATKTAVDGYHVYLSADVCACSAEFLNVDMTYTIEPTTAEFQALYGAVGSGDFSTLTIDTGITDYKTF